MAVDGRADQPGHLVLGPDRLGQQHAPLGRGQLGRGRELDGGQAGQVGRVDQPHRGAAVAAEGGLGGAAGDDPLAAGPADPPRGGQGAGQGGGQGDQGRQVRPGAGVGRRGRRGGQGGGGRQPGPGAGVDGHALAGVQPLDGGHQMAGLGLVDPAGRRRPGVAVEAGDPLQPVGGGQVQLGPGDPHRPGRPDRVPGQPLVWAADPAQPVADRVAVAAGDGALGVADAQAGLLGGAGRLDLRGGGRRGHLDRVGRVEPGDVAVDAVALAAAEVVVDHLDDLGGAVAGDPGRGPQPGDPLGPPGHRRDPGQHPDQQHHPREQDRVDAPAPSGPHGRDRSTR